MTNPSCSDRRAEKRPPPPSTRGRPCFPAYYALLLLPLLLSQPPITDRLYPVDDLDDLEEQLVARKAKLEVKATRVDTLKHEVTRWRSRTETLFQIAESRVQWSLKLRDLAGFVRDEPGAWVEEIRLYPGGRADGIPSLCPRGALMFRFRLLGSNLRRLARFRDTLKIAPNFAYHFGQLQGGCRTSEGAEGDGPTIEARLVLPLRSLDRR